MIWIFLSWACLFTFIISRGKFGRVMKCSKKDTGEVFAAKFVTCARREDRWANSKSGLNPQQSDRTILMSPPIGHHYSRHPVIINAIKILFPTICQQAECRAGSGNHELFEKSPNSSALRGLWQREEWDVSRDRIVRGARVNILYH